MALKIEELRAMVLAMHRAGNHAESDRLCAEILRLNPVDFEVLHLCGIIAHQTGRHNQAVALLNKAIGLKNGVTSPYLSLGAALMALGRYQEALARFEEALLLEPQLAKALIASAAALRALGCADEALARARAALRKEQTAAAFFQQGAAQRKLGRFLEATESLKQAIALQPDHVEAHTSLGIALSQRGLNAEALTSFERALALRPAAAEVHNNRANILRRLKRLPEALASYERAIALRPKYADARNNLAVLQYEMNQPAAALANWRRALELQPGMNEVRGNICNALRDLDRPDEALAEAELGILENPESSVNHCDLANALFDLGRFAEALVSYDRAIALDRANALALFNKGLCLLLQGNFAQGLPLYEQRKQLGSYPTQLNAARTWLNDEDIAGKTLLIRFDQALGDTIQFCRYARLAANRGAHVILVVQPQLRGLLEGLDPRIRIVSPDEQPEECHFQCALLSLPLAFGTTLANVPGDVPYLFPEAVRAARWHTEIRDDDFNVGVVWQGSRNRIDLGRSVPLEMFGRLASVPGVRLISLQKNLQPDEQRTASNLGIQILRADFDEGPQAFLDSAALMTHLDLIITSDTAMAHLAGALGRPTWVAVKHVPDWRWLLDRNDCPWYPSVRLFRQSRRGNWHSVFEQLLNELVLAKGGGSM